MNARSSFTRQYMAMEFMPITTSGKAHQRKFTMSMTNDFDYRMGSSRQLTLLPPERIKQIGLDNIPELVRNSYTYLLPDRLDKYVEAWAEVKAAS